MTRQKWLVLGAGGRLGRALCTPSRPWLVPTLRSYIDASIADRVCAAVKLIDAVGVINLAAAADVARCEREPEWAFEQNVLTVAGAARGAFLAGVGLVQVSTDYVFGESDTGPDALPRDRAPWWPDSKRAPVNVYGRTKMLGEDAMAWGVIDARSGGGRVTEEEYHHWASKSAVVRMSFLADPPNYAWVAGGVRCTKEWVDQAARRLDHFVSVFVDPYRESGLVVHLVPERETTLDALVHERYPDVPVVPYEEAVRRLPYRLPRDLRLGKPWRPS